MVLTNSNILRIIFFLRVFISYLNYEIFYSGNFTVQSYYTIFRLNFKDYFKNYYNLYIISRFLKKKQFLI